MNSVNKRGSLEWDQLGKWVIGIAVLILILLIILAVKGVIDFNFIRNLRFG